MRYRVTHRTTYSYDDDVTGSFGIAHCRPRELPWQQVASREISIDPAPSDLTDDTDYYGNVVSYFHVTEPHMRLTIDAVSEVDGRADRVRPRRAAASRGSTRGRS